MTRGVSKETKPIDEGLHMADRHKWASVPILNWLRGKPLNEERDHAIRRSLRRRMWGLGPFLEEVKKDDGYRQPEDWPV